MSSLSVLRRRHRLAQIPARARPRRYPVGTMWFQSLGSLIVATEALLRCVPSVFIDTTGCAFTYPLLKALSVGTRVVAYTHYPTITAEMLGRVHERRPTYNNDELVANNATLTWIKVWWGGWCQYFFTCASSQQTRPRRGAAGRRSSTTTFSRFYTAWRAGVPMLSW